MSQETEDRITSQNHIDLRDWYIKEKNSFEFLAKKVAMLLEDLIKTNEIEHHSITYRTKDLDSLITKVKIKNYTDPQNQVHDYAGIRIVTFVKSDVLKICELIEREFNIDLENSSDKSEELGEDKVGYRSVHYIARLNNQRSELSEYSLFREKCFEIQVRTILEHAWADISHDRTYKFDNILPEKNEIRRRFALASASLEMIDREFDRLSNEIKDYSLEVSRSTKHGNLIHNIDSTSLIAYMNEKFLEQINQKLVDPTLKNTDKEIIIELNSMGIYRLDQLDEVLNKIIALDYLTLSKIYDDLSFLSILRDSLMIHDINLYLTKAINGHWTAIEPEGIKLLKHFIPDIESIFENFNIYILNSYSSL